MKSSLIKLDDVSFGYNEKKLNIEKLSININNYGLIGLLGHNGAGKTTLFKILLGLIQPQYGDIQLNKNLLYQENELSIAYMPENNGLYESLTVYQNLLFRGRANGLSKKVIKEKSKKLLDKFLLVEKKNEKVSKLSNGMKKKVALIETLIIDPKVILLDEPTNGLDPESLVDIISIIKELKNHDCVVIISSHDLQFIEQVVDYIYILEKGKLVYSGDIICEKESSLLNMYINKLEEYRHGEKNIE